MKALIISTMFLTSLASFAAGESATMAKTDSICNGRFKSPKTMNDPFLEKETNVLSISTQETGSADR